MATMTKEQQVLWQQARMENRKSNHVYRESAEMSRQQALLRKQHQRLEMEKKYLSENSYLSRDRQMLADDDKSKSFHSRADVKSRLFDFEKSAPRSRRQLQESGNVSPTSRGVTPLTSHGVETLPGVEAGQSPGQDFVDEGAEASEQVPSTSETPSGGGSGSCHSEAKEDVKTVNKADITDAERPRLRRSSIQGGARDRRPSLAPVEHTETVELVSPRTRRASLQVDSLPRDIQKYPSDPSDRRGSLPADQGRRGSLPADSGRRRSLPSDSGRRGSLPADSGRRESLQYPVLESPGAGYLRVRRGSVQERRQSLSVPDPALDASDDESRPSYLRERRGSFRRPSIKPCEVDATDADEDTRRLQQLYNQAIQTVQDADSALLNEDRHLTSARGSKSRRLADPGAVLDVAALKELENILNDARLYTARKPCNEDHYRLDVCSNRAQKKRIEHLEQALRRMNQRWDTLEVDPEKILQCSYLRLSKSNVQTLEGMIRDSGKDPGIHIHSDVTDIDIWKGLREERVDLIKASEEAAEEAAARKERNRKGKRSFIKI